MVPHPIGGFYGAHIGPLWPMGPIGLGAPIFIVFFIYLYFSLSLSISFYFIAFYYFASFLELLRSFCLCLERFEDFWKYGLLRAAPLVPNWLPSA